VGQITFYEDCGCIGELGMIKDTPGQLINLQDENNTGIPANKIRSCKLSNVRDGTVIRVYASSLADVTDDWARIDVKESDFTTVIPTFECSFENEWFKIDFIKKNGLDGKISLIEIK